MESSVLCPQSFKGPLTTQGPGRLRGLMTSADVDVEPTERLGQSLANSLILEIRIWGLTKDLEFHGS